MPVGLFAVGVIIVSALGVAIYNADPPVVVPAPIVINVPPVAPPIVTVAAAEPEPAPIVEAEPAVVAEPPPRALAPTVYAACVASIDGDAYPECQWDAGFPAISPDGSTIAVQFVPDDGGRGNPGLDIHLLDANSGKLKKALEILDPNDYVSPDEEYAKAEQQQKTIAARAARANRVLAGYRTLVALGYRDELAPEETVRPSPTSMYAQISDTGATRVIDPATHEVVFQHTFGVPSPHVDPDDDGGMCPGWNMIGMGVWWDPQTRVVLSSQSYRTGGCLCSDATIMQVARMPTRI